MSSDKTALLFPGQGAHDRGLIAVLPENPSFTKRHDELCRIVGFDPLDEVAKRDADFHSNRVSSLLVVLSSVLCLDELRKRLTCSDRDLTYAGYSVGQWTAVYAAGMIDAPTLFDFVAKRAQRMDSALQGRSTGMIGVLGLSQDEIQESIDQVCGGEPTVWISNFNCAGNYSVAGLKSTISELDTLLQARGARKVVHLPVAGAWHCPLLDGVATHLTTELDKVALQPPTSPIIDNTTGTWLPPPGAELRQALGRQVSRPVLWSKGVRTLIDDGAKRFIEVGYGDVLSRFGMIIDRKCRHIPLLTARSGLALDSVASS